MGWMGMGRELFFFVQRKVRQVRRFWLWQIWKKRWIPFFFKQS